MDDPKEIYKKNTILIKEKGNACILNINITIEECVSKGNLILSVELSLKLLFMLSRTAFIYLIWNYMG